MLKHRTLSIISRSGVLAALSILFCVPLFAQDYSYYAYKQNKEAYSQPLSVLLENARQDLKIEIVCDKNVDPFLNQTVPMAPWKFWDDPELRLAYILAPLDLTFEKTDERSYRVFEPWYQNRPESEGAAHLQRLLARFPDKETWETRKAALRASLLEKLNLSPMPPKTDSEPIYTEKRSYDGYTVENVALEIIPGYWLSGSLYRPTEGQAPYPVIASPHGHLDVGRLDPNNQYRAATLARMGAIVFSYSMFAWIEDETPLKRADHRNPISGTIQTLSSIRVLDFLTSLPDADASRVGMTACSGGGTQTFLATALDDRVTVPVPVVMVSSYFFGGCPCESGLPIHTVEGGTCNAEIAAMAAPRPMLLVSDTQDWTKNTPEVEYPYIKKIYEYYGAGDKLENVHLDEPHDYGPSKRAAMYPFMAKYLGLDVSRADESKVTIESKEQMLVFGLNHEKYPENGIKNIDDLIRTFNEYKAANAPK